MLTLSRSATIAAATGGLLWTVKVAVITARDGSFDPLESWVFIPGLLALLAAAVLVAVDMSRHLRGVARIAAAVVGALALVAATLALEGIGKSLVAGLSNGTNIGLEEEGGILFAGLAWLAVAGARVVAGRSRHEASDLTGPAPAR
jgi:hypothetical protein